MANVTIKLKGLLIGLALMTKAEIRKAESAGFTIDYTSNKEGN